MARIVFGVAAAPLGCIDFGTLGRDGRMRREPILRVVFYVSEGGRESVRDWLRGLDRHDRQTIGADLKTAQFGWPMGMPLIRKLDVGLGVARRRLVRLKGRHR